MNLNEYTSYDAVGLAELVAHGEVSAAELADAAQRALQAVNPRINAVVEHWAPEEADLARARAGGPLAGVPFLIKDLGITMAGRRSESGSRLAASMVADADSMLMTRFRQAGLVTLGRSTTPEMAFSTTTESVQQGATGNPWQPALTAGGSSGGAAAAVAAGIVPVAHATDAAGSIRIPAAHTGLFGLKPTRGRNSNGPGLDEVFAGFGVQLGVSRTVRDSAALLDAVQGTPAGEPYHTAAPEQGFLREVGRDPGPLKIALMAHPWNGARSQTAMVDAVAQVGRHLQGLGHSVEPAQAPLGVSWEAFVHANAQIWTSTLVNWMDAIAQAAGRPLDASTLEPATLGSYTYGLRVSGVDYVRALDVRNRVTRTLGTWFQQYDVLLSPTLPELPLPLGVYSQGAETMDGLAWTERVFRHSPFTPAFNVAGLPAMSMPLVADTASGLPIGIQFGAGFAREDMLLRLAGQLEQSLPWIGRKPLVWAGDGR